MKVIFWKNKPIFTEIILLFICVFFFHLEFSLVLNLTMSGKLAVTRPPIIATRYVGFATTSNTRSKYLLPTEKVDF